MQYKILVFDLDDTLYPERDYVLSGFSAVDAWLKAEMGIQGFGNEAVRVYRSGIRGRIFNEVMLRLDIKLNPFMLKAMVDVYRAHLPKLALYADAKEILKEVKDRFRVCLITDGYAETQRNKVVALQLQPFFDLIVYTDELGRECWKPSDEAFLKIMRDMDCLGGMCIYVGDNPSKDFIAPNSLGWLTVHIQRTGGEYSKINYECLAPEYRAQMHITSLTELKSVFPNI